MQRLELVVQVHALAGRVGGVRRLHSEFTHALQHIAGLDQGAVCGLQQVDAVVDVAHGLVQATDLGGHVLADGQACGVVLGGIDTVTRGKLLHGGAHGLGIDLERILGVLGRRVGIDNWHNGSPKK